MKKVSILVLVLLTLLSTFSAMAESDESALAQRYAEAEALFEAKEYAAAQEAFEALGDYEDSRSRANDSKWKYRSVRYREALSLYKAKSYYEAKAIFEELGSYEESKRYAGRCRTEIERAEYRQAGELFDAGDYEGAKEMYLALGSYKDCKKRAQAAEDMIQAQLQAARELEYYEQAIALREAGDYAAARDLLIEAGDCRDATEQLYEVLALMGKADFDPDIPRFTTKQLRDDRTTAMSDVFTAPDGSRHTYRIYKGVSKWVEAKVFCEVLGGHLATVVTPEENRFVHQFMLDSGFLTAYFGLSDENRSGDWIWVTGEPFEYANWHEGEPSYSPRERYGMYFYKHTDGTWNDSHFYEHDKDDPGCSFICEWDLE